MKKQLSEEQLDRLMSRLVIAAAADETTIGEIADSPATLWGVQRRINEQKSATIFAWPPVGKILRWLMIGAPAAAAILLMLSFFLSRPAEIAQTDASVIMPAANTVEKAPDPSNVGDEKIIVNREPVQDPTTQVRHARLTAKASPARIKVNAKTTLRIATTDPRIEIAASRLIITGIPPLQSFPTVSVPTQNTGAGNGWASVNLLIPNNMWFLGSTFYARWYVQDPAAPGGIAVSQAVRFTVFGDAPLTLSN